jgi:hypothetical protein
MSSKRVLALSLMILTLTSCHEQGVRSFWKTHSIDYSDYQAAENQFADFAEMAVAAPEKEALKALDVLYDQLKKDTVAYYIYSGWMEGAFYNLLSPCRNAPLFAKAVKRMETDGLFCQDECEPYQQKLNWLQYNLLGEKAVVPGMDTFGARTLVLVLDLSCPSCRQALETLAEAPQWEGLDKVAVGCGRGPRPEVPGWNYLFPENATDVFDPHLTPIYFVVAADGTVEIPYSLALHQ